jgi:hypothetical protein
MFLFLNSENSVIHNTVSHGYNSQGILLHTDMTVLTTAITIKSLFTVCILKQRQWE